MPGIPSQQRNQLTHVVPLSQNTAPVIEYHCLYTHDLRRKQKRWQDGFVKFHTFNRRVTVYDVPRNFIGDTHYVQGQSLQEGDELNLDKGGIIVQVTDLIAQTETDVTELVQRGSNRPSILQSPLRKGSNSTSRHIPRSIAAPSCAVTPRRPTAAPKHKSLSSLLQNSGRIGRANLPSQSPFELRKDPSNVASNDASPVHKRRRITQNEDVTQGPVKAPNSAPIARPGGSNTVETPIEIDDHSTTLSIVASRSELQPIASQAIVHRHGSTEKNVNADVSSRRILQNEHPSTQDNMQDEAQLTLMLASRASRKLLIGQRRLSRATSENRSADCNSAKAEPTKLPAMDAHGKKSANTRPMGMKSQFKVDSARVLETRKRLQSRLETLDLFEDTHIGTSNEDIDFSELQHSEAAAIHTSNSGRTLETTPPAEANHANTDRRGLKKDAHPNKQDMPPVPLVTAAAQPSASIQATARPVMLSKGVKRIASARKAPPQGNPRASANPVTSILLGKPFKPVSGPEADHARANEEQQQLRNDDTGPWSREAFDLFTWRPPVET